MSMTRDILQSNRDSYQKMLWNSEYPNFQVENYNSHESVSMNSFLPLALWDGVYVCVCVCALRCYLCVWGCTWKLAHWFPLLLVNDIMDRQAVEMKAAKGTYANTWSTPGLLLLCVRDFKTWDAGIHNLPLSSLSLFACVGDTLWPLLLRKCSETLANIPVDLPDVTIPKFHLHCHERPQKKTIRTIQSAQPTHRTMKNKMAMLSNYFEVTYHAIIGKHNRLQTQFFHYMSC